MRIPLKTQIRKYIALKLLRRKVDVGGRVYPNQPSPRFLNQLPCVCVFYGTEANEITMGDRYNPAEYEKDLRVIIDVIGEEQIRADLEPEMNDSGEDLVDLLAEQVERAMEWDSDLSKLSENPDDPCSNLSRGIMQLSSDPYKIAEEGDRRVFAQRLTFAVPYLRETFAADKLNDFLYYGVEINEPGTDRTLTGAEGNVRQ